MIAIEEIEKLSTANLAPITVLAGDDLGQYTEIKQKLFAGMTRRQVAQDTGMSIFSLYNYINQTPELKQALEAVRNA